MKIYNMLLVTIHTNFLDFRFKNPVISMISNKISERVYMIWQAIDSPLYVSFLLNGAMAVAIINQDKQ